MTKRPHRPIDPYLSSVGPPPVVLTADALRASNAFSPTYTTGELAQSLALVRPEIDALPAGEVGHVNLHAPTAALTVLGALTNVEKYLDEAVVKLPKHDFEQMGKLRCYALALIYAYMLTVSNSESEASKQAILAEGLPLRERLLSLAEGYASYGVLDREKVAAIRSGTGQVDAAQDLVELSHLFRTNEAALAGKTPVTRAELDRAEELGMRLFFALGRRKVGGDGEAGARHGDFARTFRLTVRAYDQARRAVSYLRWNEGDVNVLLPSLFARRRGRGGAPVASPDGEGGPVPPEGPAPSEVAL